MENTETNLNQKYIKPMSIIFSKYAKTFGDKFIQYSIE